MTDLEKAAQIEAAWNNHGVEEGKAPVTLAKELLHVVVGVNANGQRCNAAGDHVIFASNEEINQCWSDHCEYKRKQRLAREQERLREKQMSVLSDRKYHNLGDLRAA